MEQCRWQVKGWHGTEWDCGDPADTHVREGAQETWLCTHHAIVTQHLSAHHTQRRIRVSEAHR